MNELDHARIDALNEALAELVRRIYAGEVDLSTGRILCGAPMGRNGFAEYGLTPAERDVLREIMLRKAKLQPRRPWLRFKRRAWYADLDAYPSELHVQFYLQRHCVTPQLYEWAVGQCGRKGRRVGGRNRAATGGQVGAYVGASA